MRYLVYGIYGALVGIFLAQFAELYYRDWEYWPLTLLAIAGLGTGEILGGKK